MENKIGRPREFFITKRELSRLYNKEKMTQKEIAHKFNLKSSHIIESRMKEYNILRRIAAKRDQYGEKNNMWKGGFYITNGYKYIKNREHPRCNKKGYVFEHILVMEKKLGRYLKFYGLNNPENEEVHHINKNTLDNRLCNLKLMKHGEHMALHRKLEAIERRKH